MLCCLLAADQDAEARRAHHRAKPKAPPPLAAEFTGKPNPPGPIRFPDTRFEPVAWSEIDGWAADDHAAAFTTFLASCRAVVGSAKGSRDTRPVYPALVDTCRKARAAGALNAEGARKFFEEHFSPVRVGKVDDPNGFLTGYYEPVVEGSRTLTDDFKVAVYGRPRDLVHMGRKRKAESFPNTGRVVRRIARGKYVPYFDRAQIEDGALATQQARDRLSEGRERSPVHPDPGLGAHPPHRRLAAARQLRFAQRASVHAGRPHPDRARHHHARRHVDGPHPQMDGGKSRTAAASCAARTSRSCSSAP